jgi:hypothetical protein
MFYIPYVKMCDRFGKNPAAWALSGNQQETYILLFLAEFGYEFEAIYNQLVSSGSVDVTAVKNKFNLSAQELRLLEQFVAQYCTESADGETALSSNRLKENDAMRGQVKFSEAIDEMQELMRERAGRAEEAALMIDINKMDAIRKTFLQLKSLLVSES